MSVLRLVQISDTHLSAEAGFFDGNWPAVLEAVATLAPDLVVNTGDLSLNGADSAADLAHARACHDDLPAPWLAIPGNHDVGDSPDDRPRRLRQPATEERRVRWLEAIGPDYWLHDVGGWRLVGLNAQLMTSGLEAEEAQWAFLVETVAEATTPVALFIHKPLFRDRPGDANAARRYLRDGAAARLLDLLEAAQVPLVASGHVHQARTVHHDGTRFVWAPSTAFVMPDGIQARIGEKQVGLVEYALHGDGHVEVTHHVPDGLTRHDLVDFPEAYGNLARVIELKSRGEWPPPHWRTGRRE